MKLLEQVKERMDLLVNSLNHHTIMYEVFDVCEMSDGEWDMLYEELIQLEKDYPQFISENSPSKRVGGKPIESFDNVVHEIPMKSLDKKHNKEDLETWIKNMIDVLKSQFGFKQVSFVLENKIDGLSLLLKYVDGILEYAETRGDGKTGDRVTENVKTIKSIPLEIKAKGTIYVTGEVFMPKKAFELVNAQLVANGKKPMENCRNAASGSLKKLNPKECAERKLAFYAYNIPEDSDISFNTQVEALNFLEEQGFIVSPDYKVFKEDEVEELLSACVTYEQQRNSLPHDIDGMVVKINEYEARQLLGETIKFPKWAMAFKFPPEKVITELLDVVWQVGRTGTLNPVAQIRTVRLAGTNVSNATLNNWNFIQELGLQLHDYVTVQKAGEIIPEIIKVNLDLRSSSCVPIEKPTTCPCCGSPVDHNDGDAEIFCLNPNCSAQLSSHLKHFASRDAMNITGLGEEISKLLIETNLVQNISDLYFLNGDKLVGLKGFARKKIDNLIAGIENSKTCELSRFLLGLGIPEVGKGTASILANKYLTLDSLMSATEEDLCTIEGIGSIMASKIRLYFSKPENLALIEHFKAAGVNMTQPVEETSGDFFAGKTFAITGTLSKPKDYFKKIITDYAGKCVSSVSAKTSYILYGEEAGSKLETAQKLVEQGKLKPEQVLNEEEFMRLLESFK